MSTKKLAKELGLLRKRSQLSNRREKSQLSNQIYSYLIVIDFESTCWREKKHYGQEIIEFPAVLLNTSTGEVEAEFHSYVQPQEHPVLSDFCTELTGITQAQVESGVPLQICLSRFSRWLQTQQLQRGVAFSRHPSGSPAPSHKLCSFVTWSDWDLGVCLQYECRRKQLHKPDVLNSWTDLRSTYRLFYSRKPKGLNGALQDLGIQFSGRQHSGLDDARNTAGLAWRMMKDGCVMKITRGPERAPLKTKPLFTNTSVNTTIHNNKDTDRGSSDRGSSDRGSSSPCLEPQPSHLQPSENRSAPCPVRNPQRNTRTSEPLQNLLSPLMTVLTRLNSPLCGGRIGTVNNNSFSSLVLVSTTMDHISHHPLLELTPDPEAVVGLEEEVPVLLESEWCGSYDDVVLEEGGEETNTATHSHTPRNTHTATCTTRHISSNTHTLNNTHKPDQPSFSVYRDPPHLSTSSSRPPSIPSSRLSSSTSSHSSSIPSSSSRPPSHLPAPLSSSTSSHPSSIPSSCSRPPSHLPAPLSSSTSSHPSSIPSSSSRPPSHLPAPLSSSTSSHPSSIPSSSSRPPSHLPAPLSSSTSSHPSSIPSSSSRPPSHLPAPLSSSTSSHPSSIPSSSSHPPSHLPAPPSSSTSRLYSSVLSSSSRPPSHLPAPLSSSTSSHPSSIPSSSSHPPSHLPAPPSSSTSRLYSSVLSSSSRPPSLLSSSLNISFPPSSRGVARITSPLCACGRRAKRQTVANGGPNHGQAFYCCPAPRTIGTATGGTRKRAGCGFFRWESAVINATAPSPRATLSSRATGSAWKSSVRF
ncbi:ERI1 exoribonuclease 2-like isoform X2 [Osmerus eperlanus]|uniref:ERI1 exoribonuclease 2-like isoform X2 n=1 Tax=Osmerus eperlanus TaxID=29151 RepID=UPI002E0DF66D